MPVKLILITGASSDIGVALIHRLLNSASPPMVLAHYHTSGERIRALESELGEDRVRGFQADFSQSTAVSAMAEEIAAGYGVPDGVVHLPALRLTYERFAKFNWQHFQDDMSIQLGSAVFLLQRFLPKMAKLPVAKVVFALSSVVHGMPPKYMSMYTVIKYAQLGLMRSLAAEYASTGVRVNGVSPGMVETRFLRDIAPVAVEMSAAANPQGRNAAPQDVLGAIEFLLSPASDFITGIDIPISAGSVC